MSHMLRGVFRLLLEGETGSRVGSGGGGVGGMRLERKRKRKISQLLCYGWDSLDLLEVTRTRQGGRLT